jgi:hypothetical protein
MEQDPQHSSQEQEQPLGFNIAAVPTRTHIEITGVASDSIGFAYKCITSDKPNTYGNFVALWQSSDGSVPYSSEPIKVFQIPANNTEGSYEFDGVTVSNVGYLVGYAVGPVLTGSSPQSYGNVCSSSYISGPAADPINFDATLLIKKVGSMSVSVSFTLPDGILPASNGAWLALWRSGSPSYTTVPLASKAITLNSPSGSAIINQPFAIDTEYTVGLFTSGYKASPAASTQTALAAYATFKTISK